MVRIVQESLRLLVIGVAVVTVVAFDPRAGYPGGRPKYLVLAIGAAIALVLLLVAAGAGGTRLGWAANPLRWPVVALVAWTAVSAMASPHPRTAVFGFVGSYDGLVTTVACAALFFATVAAYRPVQVVRALEVLCLGVGSVVLLFGMAQLVDRLVAPDTGWDWARPAIAPQTIGSTLGNPNHLAGLLAMLVPLAVVLAVRSPPRRRLAISGGIALALAELAVTAGRGGWLGLVAAMVVLAALFRHDLRPHRSRVVALTAGAVALAASALIGLGAAGVTKVDPGALVRVGPGSTVQQRFEVWAIAGRMTWDHPILGVGPDVFALEFPTYATDAFLVRYGPFTVANGAHNLFVNTSATLGVVGLAAFVSVLAVAARRMAAAWEQRAEQRAVLGGIAAALTAYLVQACLNTQTVSLTVLFWFLLGLGLAVGSASSEERR